VIESNTLPQAAIDYLNTIQQTANKQAEDLGRVGAREQLLSWCVEWITSAAAWRKQSYEGDWIKYQRDADGRYDPNLAAKKKPWQAKAFVDIVPSHRETIHAELYRLVCGSRPILDVTPRPAGEQWIAEAIRDLTLREMEKSLFEVEYNATLEDRTTYGSSIARFWHEERYEDRPVKVPIYEPLNSPAAIIRKMTGRAQILGYNEQMQPQCIYRGTRKKHISLWDFFWDPKALHIKGNTVAIKSRMTLQQILDRINTGEFMPEAGAFLSQQASQPENTATEASGKMMVEAERGISKAEPKREGNQKGWDAFDLYARLPQKHVYPLLKQPLPITDAEKLVPARIIFVKGTILAVELNKKYDGEAPVLKDDYFPVAGRFIGRGIPEMLRNPQKVVNEVVNQRLDEGNLALQEGYAVIEKGLVNPDDLLAGGPGLVVRINQKAAGPNGDVRNAILPLGRPDVKINAGFSEVHEWERMAQERTSVNRAEHGMNPLPGGAKTLGGMQLLKANAGAKFAFIQMLSEFAYLNRVFRFYWELIYQNPNPDDIISALGPEKGQAFLQVIASLTPEQIENAYKYEPKGIFEREAKAEKHARLAAIHEQFKGMPGLNDMAFFDEECKSFGMDPERLKVPDAQMQFLQAQAQRMAEPMAKQMVAQIVIGQAVKDVERNLAEKLADDKDGARPEKVEGVPDLGKPKANEGKV
jgi:hypothetical protein